MVRRAGAAWSPSNTTTAAVLWSTQYKRDPFSVARNLEELETTERSAHRILLRFEDAREDQNASLRHARFELGRHRNEHASLDVGGHDSEGAFNPR